MPAAVAIVAPSSQPQLGKTHRLFHTRLKHTSSVADGVVLPPAPCFGVLRDCETTLRRRAVPVLLFPFQTSFLYKKVSAAPPSAPLSPPCLPLPKKKSTVSSTRRRGSLAILRIATTPTTNRVRSRTTRARTTSIPNPKQNHPTTWSPGPPPTPSPRPSSTRTRVPRVSSPMRSPLSARGSAPSAGRCSVSLASTTSSRPTSR